MRANCARPETKQHRKGPPVRCRRKIDPLMAPAVTSECYSQFSARTSVFPARRSQRSELQRSHARTQITRRITTTHHFAGHFLAAVAARPGVPAINGTRATIVRRTCVIVASSRMPLNARALGAVRASAFVCLFACPAAISEFCARAIA